MIDDRLDIKNIEYGIYSYIMQDFAEYFNNRMNIYKGVVNYLDTITMKHLNNTTTEFSNTAILGFEVGKDVKIHNYFRIRFPKQNLI